MRWPLPNFLVVGATFESDMMIVLAVCRVVLLVSCKKAAGEEMLTLKMHTLIFKVRARTLSLAPLGLGKAGQSWCALTLIINCSVNPNFVISFLQSWHEFLPSKPTSLLLCFNALSFLGVLLADPI